YRCYTTHPDLHSFPTRRSSDLRATIDGKPYAYTQLRDTYFHEVDPSALGFANFNNPRKMRNPQDFFRSANHISYTFNWFYADNRSEEHTSELQSLRHLVCRLLL